MVGANDSPRTLLYPCMPLLLLGSGESGGMVDFLIFFFTILFSYAVGVIFGIIISAFMLGTKTKKEVGNEISQTIGWTA